MLFGSRKGFGSSTPVATSTFGQSSLGNNNTITDPNNGIQVAEASEHTIQELAWSPKALHLVAGSWDGSVRCWEVSATGAAKGLGMKKHDKPVLDVCWACDGDRIFSAAADKTCKMWTCASGAETQIAIHDQAISSVCASNEHNKMVVTGSWDHTIRYWTTNSITGKPMAEVNCEDRVYTMDMMDPMLVVGTAANKVLVFDVRKGQAPVKTYGSQLKLLLRKICCFPDQKGYLAGSIGGRVSVRYFEETVSQKAFTFKCHRVDDKIYPINSLDFNPAFGTFLTAGADGSFVYWDKDKKQKVKSYSTLNAPITAARFSKDGKVLAYAAGYDWHKGHSQNPPNQKAKLFLRDASEARKA